MEMEGMGLTLFAGRVLVGQAIRGLFPVRQRCKTGTEEHCQWFLNCVLLQNCSLRQNILHCETVTLFKRNGSVPIALSHAHARHRSPDGTILFVTESSGRVITYKPYGLDTVNSNNQKQFLGGCRAASPLH